MPSPDSDEVATSRRRSDRRKICAAMVLQHYCVGAWAVTLGTYITANTGELGRGLFEPGFAGMVLGAAAIGAIASPFVSGWLADRYFATERLLFVLHAAAASSLAIATIARDQTEFYAALVIFYVCYSPTNSLLSSLAFHHLDDCERDFPVVRAWGTGGWVAAGITVGLIWPLATGHSIEATLRPLQIGVAAECLAALFCLRLPHTPPAGTPKSPSESVAKLPAKSNGLRRSQLSSFLSGESLQLLLKPTLFFSLLIAFLAAVPTQFYYAYGNVFFNETGLEYAAAKMSLGQITEIVCMIILPMVLLRFGLKLALLAGVGAWVIRYLALSLAATTTGLSNAAISLDLLAILMHGAAYAFINISLQVYLYRIAGNAHRATAQGLLVIATSGFGNLAGAYLAGLTGRAVLSSASGLVRTSQWSLFWLLPAGASFAVLLIILLFFRSPPRQIPGEQAGNSLDSEPQEPISTPP